MESGVTIKKQNKFPYLSQFKDKFPFTDVTIFVFDKTIYSNNEIPYDIIHHELQHLRQQQRIGAKNWILRYLDDKKFRLEQELEAYVIQLKEVKKMNDPNELFNILDECANNISSKLYGSMITKKRAMEYFRDNLTKIK